jgi:release factor glutamine methyltransferase
MNIAEAIRTADERLRIAGVDEHHREAASLLAHIIGREAVFLIAHPEYELTGAVACAFDEVVARRERREPFHYIVGRKESYGLEFEVASGVLIPRPETEILVEDAIESLSALADPDLFEIGVGSGCISVSILVNVPNGLAVAVDISGEALSIAGRNAARHGVADRLELRKGDVYEGLEGAFDLIVSNPPYIPDGDLASLQAEVGGFEPHGALFGGGDGLDIVRRIVSGAPRFLKPGGGLLIEIGFGQAESVKDMFEAGVWEDVDFLPDMQRIPRIAKARSRS